MKFRKSYKNRGLSLVDFLLAAVIISVLGSLFMIYVSTSLSKITEMQYRSMAVTAANNVLENAGAFDCGFVTGFESDAQMQNLERGCWNSSQYSNNSLSNIPKSPVGTSSFDYTMGGITFHMVYKTTWHVGNEASLIAKDAIIHANHQPTALKETVEVTWKAPSESQKSTSISTLTLVPDASKFTIPRTGVLLNGVMPNHVYRINGKAVLTTGPDENFLWVPFVYPGSSVEVRDLTSSTVWNINIDLNTQVVINEVSL